LLLAWQNAASMLFAISAVLLFSHKAAQMVGAAVTSQQ
jgi:hypothetical protein